MREHTLEPGPGVSGNRPDIDKIKARYEAATAGLWKAKTHCFPTPPSPPCTSAQVEPALDGPVSWADAEFIAACHADIPLLVAALQEAQAQLEIMTHKLEILGYCGPDVKEARAILGESQ